MHECFFASLDRLSLYNSAYILRPDPCALHYYPLKTLESNGHLFANVVLIMGQKLISFFIALYMVSLEKIHSVALFALSSQWLRFSDSQKANLLLFGFSCLSNDEKVKMFSHVQQFIKESKQYVLFLFFRSSVSS